MANPFDQFDNAKSNPFDQFDQRQDAQPAAVQPLQDGPGFWGTVGDAAAAGVAGAGRGAMDLIGLPGTIANGINSGGQWLLRNGYELATGEAPQPDTFFGGPSEQTQAMLPFGGRNMLSGSVLKEGLADKTFGASDYQPTTTAGKYARTVGEFLPGAAVFGGANVANLLRSGVAPALSSEAAGQLTEGTALEPYARVAGALVGGAAASRIGRPSAEPLPTAREIKDSAGYAALKEPMKGAKLNQDAYQGIIKSLRDEADDFGLTTKLKGEVSGTLKDFTSRAKAGDASLYDLEVLRRSLRNIGGDKLDNASQALSAKLVDKLDDAVENLSASSISASGETGRPILDVLEDARQTYRVGMKSQMIENAVEKAKNAASGFENGLRVEFRKLVNNPKNARQFSDVERAAMESVVKGTPTSNALRWLGGFGVPVDNGRNFLGSVIGGGAGSAIGSAVGGPVGAAIGGPLMMGIGTAAKLGANAATRNQAAIAEALVKGGPAASAAYSTARSAAQQASREAIVRALLQSQGAVGSAQKAGVPLAQPR